MQSNLAQKIEVNNPPMRPPPVGAVKVTMNIEFIDGTGSSFIGHNTAGIVRDGVKVHELVMQLIDQNALWFDQWWASAHAEKYKEEPNHDNG